MNSASGSGRNDGRARSSISLAEGSDRGDQARVVHHHHYNINIGPPSAQSNRGSPSPGSRGRSQATRDESTPPVPMQRFHRSRHTLGESTPPPVQGVERSNMVNVTTSTDNRASLGQGRPEGHPAQKRKRVATDPYASESAIKQSPDIQDVPLSPEPRTSQGSLFNISPSIEETEGSEPDSPGEVVPVLMAGGSDESMQTDTGAGPSRDKGKGRQAPIPVDELEHAESSGGDAGDATPTASNFQPHEPLNMGSFMSAIAGQFNAIRKGQQENHAATIRLIHESNQEHKKQLDALAQKQAAQEARHNDFVKSLSASILRVNSNQSGRTVQLGNELLDHAAIEKDPFRDHPRYTDFLAVIRMHVLRLLRLESLEERELKRLPPPLTDREVQMFLSSALGCPIPTVEDWRIDLQRPPMHPFNVEAEDVFARDLRHKIIDLHWYPLTPIPEELLELNYITLHLRSHLKYIRARWKDATNDDEAAKAIKKQNNLSRVESNSRRQRIFDNRLDTMENSPELRRHHQFYKLWGSGVVSGNDDSNPLFWRKIVPKWRSKPLQDLGWKADSVREEIRSQPIAGHRKVRGPRATPRRHDADNPLIDDKAKAPRRLPRNCYDDAWFNSRSATEQLLLAPEPWNYPFEDEEYYRLAHENLNQTGR